MNTADNTAGLDNTRPDTNPIDIFSDPARLALGPNYATPTEQVLLRLAVKKPHKQQFFRVNPDVALRQQVLLLEYGESREMYLVVPELYQELTNVAQPYVLYFYITRDRTPAIWPVRLPGPDGRTNPWWDTAHAAAELALTDWVRLEPDVLAGNYKLYRPQREGLIPEPQWPTLSLSDILRLAFSGRFINSVGHTIIRQLRGEE